MAKRLTRYGVLISVMALLTGAGTARAAQVVKGTLVGPASEGGLIRIATGDKTIAIRPADGATVTRGQVGKDARKVDVGHFAVGDHIVAVIDQHEHATSVKAFYGIIAGKVAKMDGSRVRLRDGRSVPLNASAGIVLPGGTAGTAADLKPDAVVVCRVNPVSGQAWAVVVTGAAPVPAAVKPIPVPKPPAPTAAITSLTYSAPTPLTPGSTITVHLKGTTGAKASFSVRGLFPPTTMTEVSPGAYRASVTVPTNKHVRSAPLIARLTEHGKTVATVQASRLVTVDAGTAVRVTETPPAPPKAVSKSSAAGPPSPRPEPPKPVAVPPPAPEPPPTGQTAAARPRVTIDSPANGTLVTRTISVNGKAQPGASVRVTITYTNGRAGILKLSGEVASQLVAVGKNGVFRMGPLALEGPLASNGLQFVIRSGYPDAQKEAAQAVIHVGRR